MEMVKIVITSYIVGIASIMFMLIFSIVTLGTYYMDAFKNIKQKKGAFGTFKDFELLRDKFTWDYERRFTDKDDWWFYPVTSKDYSRLIGSTDSSFSINVSYGVKFKNHYMYFNIIDFIRFYLWGKKLNKLSKNAYKHGCTQCNLKIQCEMHKLYEKCHIYILANKQRFNWKEFIEKDVQIENE